LLIGRVPLTAVAGIVALVAWTGDVSGSPAGNGAAGAKVHVAVKERLSSKPNADQTHSGKFSLELNGLIKDSGTSLVSPTVGASDTVDGQLQYALTGEDNLKTKTGTLSFSFTGITILVNGKFSNEYGSWKIQGGTGSYKGWKGGGRWADVGTPSADNIEWDGFVTHP
jgi:hypothetical protein